MTNSFNPGESAAFNQRWNRRKAIPLLGSVAISAVAVPLGATAQDATPVPDSQTATMPDWRLTLVALTDPYGGQITKPDSLPSTQRVVSCEIIINNQSPQPLEFQITDIRLRDVDGVEYRAGSVLGVEPRVVSQNLPDGERTRGWVWFAVPTDATLSSLVFICPPPVLKVPLE